MTKLVICGSKGRMGQILLACAARNPQLQVVGQVDLGDDLRSVLEAADAVVDFSFPNATLENATLCAWNHKALVIGAHWTFARAETPDFGLPGSHPDSLVGQLLHRRQHPLLAHAQSR